MQTRQLTLTPEGREVGLRQEDERGKVGVSGYMGEDFYF